MYHKTISIFNSISWHDFHIIGEVAIRAIHNYRKSVDEVVEILKSIFCHMLQPKLHTHHSALCLRHLKINAKIRSLLFYKLSVVLLNNYYIMLSYTYWYLLEFLLLKRKYWEIILLKHFSYLLVSWPHSLIQNEMVEAQE